MQNAIVEERQNQKCHISKASQRYHEHLKPKINFNTSPLGEGGSCKGAQKTRENFKRRPESAASGVDKSFSSVLPSFL
jgi:hypothetical protein